MPVLISDRQRLQAAVDSLAHRLAPHYPLARAGLNKVAGDWLSSLKPNSIRAFALDMRIWAALAMQTGEPGPLLARQAIHRFVDEMRGSGRSAATIARILHTVRQVRLSVGADDPEGEDLIRAIRGVHERGRFERRCRQHDSSPLTLQELRRIGQALDTQSCVDTETLAIAWTLYDSQLPPRRLLGDRHVGNWRLPPATLSWLKRTKDGCDLLVPAGDGVEESTCFLTAETLSWIDRYLQLRGEDRILFTSSRGTPWEPERWLNQLRRIARSAGLTGHYGRASCRRGAAADMLRAGMSIEDVRRAAGWGSIEPVLRMIESPAQPEPMRRLASIQKRSRPKVFDPVQPKPARGGRYISRRAVDIGQPRTGDLFEGGWARA